MGSKRLVALLVFTGIALAPAGAFATGVCIGDPRACTGGGGRGGGGGGAGKFANVILNISNGSGSGQFAQARAGEEQQGEVPTSNGVFEGDTCVFTISRKGPADKPASVDWKTKDGTAVAGDGKGGDYVADQGTANFKPGQREAFVFIQTLFDFESEPDEKFFVILKNPKKAVIDDRKGKCVIFANSGGD